MLSSHWQNTISGNPEIIPLVAAIDTYLEDQEAVAPSSNHVLEINELGSYVYLSPTLLSQQLLVLENAGLIEIYFTFKDPRHCFIGHYKTLDEVPSDEIETITGDLIDPEDCVVVPVFEVQR